MDTGFYGSARTSYINMLDPIHHQGIIIATGAFRTSPAASLYVEANEPSLYHRREKLSLQYTLKLKANPQNPIYQDTFHPFFFTGQLFQMIKYLNFINIWDNNKLGYI